MYKSKRIGIIAAMKKEAELVESLMENRKVVEFPPFLFIEGKISDTNIVLARSGMGKVNAAVCASEMINKFTLNCIINTGVAGGLDFSLKTMDVVVGTDMVYHDVWCGPENDYGQIQGLPSVFHGDKDLCKKALSIKCDVNIVPGLICTGDKFITDGKVLDGIKKEFPKAFAVDMESCAIAQVCFLFKMPFLSFRIISDTPGNNEDSTSQYLNFFDTAAEKSFEVVKSFINII